MEALLSLGGIEKPVAAAEGSRFGVWKPRVVEGVDMPALEEAETEGCIGVDSLAMAGEELSD